MKMLGSRADSERPTGRAGAGAESAEPASDPPVLDPPGPSSVPRAEARPESEITDEDIPF